MFWTDQHFKVEIPVIHRLFKPRLWFSADSLGLLMSYFGPLLTHLVEKKPKKFRICFFPCFLVSLFHQYP
jgi:hypothetical protein